MTEKFLEHLGVSVRLPESCNAGDYYSDLIRGVLKVDHISRGRVTCSFTVTPSISNFYNGLHGGAVAAVAEKVAIACARTIVPEEKPIFPGEQSISYLSSAPINAELVVDGSVARSGRNMTVVSVEFRLKKAGKLVYTAHETLFHIAVSKL